MDGKSKTYTTTGQKMTLPTSDHDDGMQHAQLGRRRRRRCCYARTARTKPPKGRQSSRRYEGPTASCGCVRDGRRRGLEDRVLFASRKGTRQGGGAAGGQKGRDNCRMFSLKWDNASNAIRPDVRTSVEVLVSYQRERREDTYDSYCPRARVRSPARFSTPDLELL